MAVSTSVQWLVSAVCVFFMVVRKTVLFLVYVGTKAGKARAPRIRRHSIQAILPRNYLGSQEA